MKFVGFSLLQQGVFARLLLLLPWLILIWALTAWALG